MLFTPTNLIPSAFFGNNTINVDVPNTFSFQINGTAAVSRYEITIRLNIADGGIIYQTASDIPHILPIDSLGKAQRIEVEIPADSGMVNGHQYKYSVEVFGGTFSAKSAEETFFTKATPSLNFSVNPLVNTKSHSFLAMYHQPDGGRVKHFTWLLRDLTRDTIIYNSGEVYEQDIWLNYNGFLSGHNYSVRLVVIDQDNYKLDSGEIGFSVEYNTLPVEGFIELIPMQAESAVKVNINPILISGQIGSTDPSVVADDTFAFIHHYYYLENDCTWLGIGSGAKLFYNEINDRPIRFRGHFTHIMKIKLFLNESNQNQTVYCATGTLNGMPYSFEIYTRSYALYFNEIRNMRKGVEQLLCHYSSFTDIITLVITSTAITVDIIRDSQYLHLINDYSALHETFDVAISISPRAIFDSLIFYGNIKIAYFWVLNAVPSPEIVAACLETFDKPTWIKETQLLARYEHDYNAGNLNLRTEDFLHWSIYREERIKGTMEFVARISAVDIGVIDYFISSNGSYRYLVYPESQWGFSLPYITDPIEIRFQEWTLLTSEEGQDDENNLNHHSTYRFNVGCESSDIGNNNNPNLLVGFTKYPKAQIVNSNYLSGQLQAMVGEFGEECEEAWVSVASRYLTALELSEELYGLSTDGRRKFLKDPMGRVIEVAISAPITQRPQTDIPEKYGELTLPWTQIGLVNDKTMTRVLPYREPDDDDDDYEDDYEEDIPYDIRDITLYQPNLATLSAVVYGVAISENGEPVVVSSPYVGQIRGTVPFIKEYTLEGVIAKETAIEFSGLFQLFGGNDKYLLTTEEKPWVFWIDSNDELWRQYGDEVDTRALLATQALKLSAVRGWNSWEHREQDMGFVVAYIKLNGTVAYRVFMDTPTLQGVWMPEEIIEEAGNDNTFVHVHRLNDYRIGFAVTGVVSKLFVTARSLVGQGIKPEHNHIGISTITNFWQLHTSEPVTPPLILYAEFFNNDQYRVVITGNYPFALKSDINMPSQNLSIAQSGANKPITSLEIIDGALHLTFSATVSPSPDTVVRANALTYLQYILEDGQRPYWPNADITIPGEPLRYSFPEHNVIGIRAETRFEQIRINYPSRELPGEHNVIGISANVASFTHTHIAYNYITHEQPPGEHNKIGISAAVVTFNMVPIGTDPL